MRIIKLPQKLESNHFISFKNNNYYINLILTAQLISYYTIFQAVYLESELELIVFTSFRNTVKNKQSYFV